MKKTIIGRQDEIVILNRLLQSREPELLAVYGRRRIGKTYLIHTFLEQHLVFSCSGQANGNTKEQLVNFTRQLNRYFPEKGTTLAPGSWQEAFYQLQERLEAIKDKKKKKVLFFDELPWLDTHKSGFLSSFGYFWNMYAANRSDLLVVICGSAASWMIHKVVNNKGGLHNRITQRMRLLPFTLKETEDYLQYKNIKLDRYQLLRLYMITGGVPAYLNAVEKGKSADQNIENMCFRKDGKLTEEFNNLYAALFNKPERHIQVIEALAKKRKGLTRSEILATANLLTGGGITEVLNELTESGFILKVYPYDKKERETLYRLADEYSLFYLKFMQHQKGNEKGQWISRMQSPAYTAWCGYAFENVCLSHIEAIKRGLQIAGVQSVAASWVQTGTIGSNGAQIDLLIDRADQCINICEMKFSQSDFTIDKRYASELANKLKVFRDNTRTRKTLFLTLITTYGVKKNTYYTNLVQSELIMDDLFQ
ncbi:MAG: ATP-binding protein [Niabella sp.]